MSGDLHAMKQFLFSGHWWQSYFASSAIMAAQRNILVSKPHGSLPIDTAFETPWLLGHV